MVTQKRNHVMFWAPQSHLYGLGIFATITRTLVFQLQVQMALEEIDKWHYNIIRLEKVYEYRSEFNLC